MNPQKTEIKENRKVNVMCRMLFFVLMLAIACDVYADYVIGDWENTHDGWTDWNGGSDVALSTLPSKYAYSTTWKSVNSRSLKLTHAGWNQNLTIRSYQSTYANFVADFLAHTKISIDLHFEADEWADGTYAEIYALAIQGTGVSWVQYDMGADNQVDVNNPSSPGHWDKSTGTYTTTITWDYSTEKATMVTAGLTASSGYVNFIFATNCSSSGNGSFYFDNVKFVNDPEAYNPSPADEATEVSMTPTLSWTAGHYTQSTNGHDVYLGTDYNDVNNADTSDTTGIYQDTTSSASYQVTSTLRGDTLYYWRVDEVNGASTWKGDIWSFTTTTAAKASGASPADNARGIEVTPLLSWTAGGSSADANGHELYLGTDFNDVNDADNSDANGIYLGNPTDPNYQVEAELEYGATYYWRVDEVNGVDTWKGDIWSFDTTGCLTITKCKIKAGKTQGADADDINNIKDYITMSGTAVFPPDLNGITTVDINIIAQSNDELVYEQTGIDFSVVNNKFSHSYKIPKYTAGRITSMKMDFVKNTFSIKTKNIDLTGIDFNDTLQVNITMGDNVVSGTVDEVVINGSKKRIPTRLQRMYKDTLVVTKAKVKNNSLSVKGEIAVEDIVNDDLNEPNLVIYDVNFIWGDQTFKLLAGDLAAYKTGHRYKCSKIEGAEDGNDGLVTVKFDLDKCTFTMSVKDANNLNLGADADVGFGITFGDVNETDFDEAVDVNMTRKQSY